MFMYQISSYSLIFQKHRRLLKKTITKNLTVFLITIFLASALHAQTKDETTLGFDGIPLSCDDSVALQDYLVTEALAKLKENSVLFVVVSQGVEENSDSLLQRRIYNVRQYFRDRGSRLSGEKIVVVIGEPVPGNGRIEYYINGKLSMRLLYPKNGYICHSCCGPDKNFYPEKEVYEIQQKQQKRDLK